MTSSSAKSAPAQKSGPSPASTTTLVSRSAASPPRPSTSSSIISELTALRCSGRASVIRATGPPRSTVISGIVRARSFDDGDDVALLNDAALLHADFPDRPAGRRLHGDLHLPGLEDDERVALLHRVAGRDDDLPHVRDHLGLDVHPLRPPSNGRAGAGATAARARRPGRPP